MLSFGMVILLGYVLIRVIDGKTFYRMENVKHISQVPCISMLHNESGTIYTTLTECFVECNLQNCNILLIDKKCHCLPAHCSVTNNETKIQNNLNSLAFQFYRRLMVC